MSDAETTRLYAAKAQEYADLTEKSAQADPILAAFIADLPQNAHVLDLGCGPGQMSLTMAEAGHRVTALDAVAEMVALIPDHANITPLHGDFDTTHVPHAYDGIWANFSLLHATRDALPRHLSSLHSALRPKGLFHIGMKLGTDTKRDAIGRRYTYVTQDELTHLLTNADFTVTAHHLGRDKGLDGTYADWIVLRAYG
ncbi:SAM-dependent methyltransferase [Sulfitobacter sp. SK012]|uniref:class I SAM-dependent methyltransferase n=1 Tax=Sulfitobacter sp. SK012 TaxID=1389005 RepID=UPI000E0C7454|nr:class I SAM-dependent methyltransferase [Sulfitobacter sp. SK012]AXI45054.1 SAM-dependent methyltransferase [Sulfitobacter sp. SK012]